MTRSALEPPWPQRRQSRGAPDTSGWPVRARESWERIQAHVFDQPGSALPFSKRLARDNDWSQAFADEVVEEYRRFVFLAGVSEHPVTPSDQVDQAWHLHLLYTRDYWQVFCPEALRFELHHGPTRGGAEQGETFEEQYSQTRYLYLRWFGHHPPLEVWPPASIRFGRDVRWIRINRDDYEITPRGTEPTRRSLSTMFRSFTDRFRRRLGRLFACVTPLLFLTVSLPAQSEDPRPSSLKEAEMNPYGLSATAFLWFYVLVVTAIGLGLPYLVRRSRIQAGRGIGLGTRPDGPLELAMLAGGPKRAVLAAVAWLHEHGHARVSKGRVTVETMPGESSHPLIGALAGSEPRSLRARDFSSRKVRRAVRQMRRDLIDRGLLVDIPTGPRWTKILAWLAPLLIAFPRLQGAVGTDRPVGFLVLMMLAATVVSGVVYSMLAGAREVPTEGGEEAILESTQLWSGSRKDDPGAYLPRAALLGGAALIGTDLAGMEGVVQGAWSTGVAPSRAGNNSSGCSGATGCGDGGGGCGGCGGCGG